MSNSKIYDTWVARIDTDEPLSEGQIKQFCQAIYAVSAGYTAGGKRTNLSDEESYALSDLFDEVDGTNITRQQRSKGIAYIERYGKKIGLPEGKVLDFRFVGVRVSGSGYRPSFLPIYRTYLDDGRAYEYSVSPWQAGADVRWCWVTSAELPNSPAIDTTVRSRWAS